MTSASPLPQLPANAPRIRMDANSARYLTYATLIVGLSLAAFATIISYFPDQFGRLPSVVVAMAVCAASLLPLRRGNGPQALTNASYGSLLYLTVAAVTGAVLRLR